MSSSCFPPSILGLLALATTGCNFAPGRADSGLHYWFENMRAHDFSPQEAAAATGLGLEEARRRLATSRSSDAGDAGDRIRVLPYPGGRHPRIGFLDGAIDPQRDTKLSIFCPWEDGGYLVVDLPEALWRDGAPKRELMYLAHTHIATVWDRQEIQLEAIDWVRKPDAVLESRRRLPDGVEFGARVVPQRAAVEMELWLRNGSAEKLSGLRTQICVMLKAAPDFNAQTDDNKIRARGLMATGSRDGRRWVLTLWQRAKPRGNQRVPCMHSDPTFADLAPGEEARLRGRLWFYEGDDPQGEIERALEAFEATLRR